MDTGSWFSVTNVVLVLSGIAVGVVAGHFASPSIGEAKRLRSELDRMLREHETYRASVNQHFRKTADLVGQMTKSYAAVYDHLAGGARTFCDDAGPGQKLPFEPLPGELASPVVASAAVETPVVETPDFETPDAAADSVATTTDEPVASGWPTDVVIDDTAAEQDAQEADVAEDAHDAEDAEDASTDAPDPKSGTTSPSS